MRAPTAPCRPRFPSPRSRRVAIRSRTGTDLARDRAAGVGRLAPCPPRRPSPSWVAASAVWSLRGGSTWAARGWWCWSRGRAPAACSAAVRSAASRSTSAPSRSWPAARRRSTWRSSLGLGDDVVHPATSRAAVWSRGALHPMPTGTVMGVPSDASALAGLLTADEVRRASTEVVSGPVADDVGVAQLVADRLGQAVVDRLVDPLLGGVYAGRAERLSARATLPALWPAARDGRPLGDAVAAAAAAGATTGGPVFAGLRGGVGRLADVLVERLRAGGVEVRTGACVQAVWSTRPASPSPSARPDAGRPCAPTAWCSGYRHRRRPGCWLRSCPRGRPGSAACASPRSPSSRRRCPPARSTPSHRACPGSSCPRWRAGWSRRSRFRRASGTGCATPPAGRTSCGCRWVARARSLPCSAVIPTCWRPRSPTRPSCSRCRWSPLPRWSPAGRRPAAVRRRAP